MEESSKLTSVEAPTGFRTPTWLLVGAGVRVVGGAVQLAADGGEEGDGGEAGTVEGVFVVD